MPRPVLIHFCLGILLIASFPHGAVAAGSAVVRGASSLNVRSGPGREHPSFATLKEGSTVEVEATEGSWVRIRTPDGETGYVHKAFLVPLDEAEPTPTPVGGGGGVIPPSEAGTAVVSETSSVMSRENAPHEPNGDLSAGQQRLERAVEDLREKVEQLLETTRQRDRNPGAARPTATPTPVVVGITPVDATESGSLLGLSIIGLVAGFILGTIYGRRQERGRRTRVRF